MAIKNNEAIARAVFFSGDAVKRAMFDALFNAEPQIDAGTFNISTSSELTEALANQLSKTNNPLVVVIDDTIADAEVFALSKRVDELRPDAGIVWVASSKKADAVAAMQAGIRAILAPPADDASVKATVIETALAARKRWESVVANTAGAQQVDTRGAGITIISPKGGVGKTTVSTNIAVGLAKKAPNQVVLVDLDIQFGDVSSALGLKPTHTLMDIVKGPAKNDLLVLKSFLSEHESGLRVVPAPLAPEEASLITVEEVTNLLKTLINEFEYVIIDTAPGFNELTLAALELSADTVVVSELDVPSIRGVRKALDVLQALNIAGNKRHIVMNNMGRDGGLKMADARKLISEPVEAEIPSSSKVMYSTNEGVPLLSRAKRGRAAQQMQKLVDRLTRNVKPGAYTPNEGVVA